MYKIQNKDITIVVQGPVDPVNTPKCIASIRKYFKGSKIILSTWEGTDTYGLDFDELVLSKDPGGTTNQANKLYFNNVNRQIVSSFNGLQLVTTKYALKIRSDFIILSGNFIKYFNKFPERSENYRLYKKRILTYCFTSKFKLQDENTPFLTSDWIFFGLTTDLLKMFDIPLNSDEDDLYFVNGFPTNAPSRFAHQPLRYFPEQYICCKPFLKEFPEIQFIHRFCNDEKMINISNVFIANNYIILNDFQMPVFFAKRKRNEYIGYDFEYLNNAIDYFKWLSLYKKYCNPTLKYPSFQKNIHKNIIRIIYKNKCIRKFIAALYDKILDKI